MDTKYDFDDTQERIVYVRSVETADLPEEIRTQLGGLEQVFAVHRADGARLALVRNRSLAFTLARQNDLAPVTVH